MDSGEKGGSRMSYMVPGFPTLGKEKVMVDDRGPIGDGWANTSES